MRIVSCHTCQKSYQIGGNIEEVTALLGPAGLMYQCITPLCGGRMEMHKAASSVYPMIEVPVREFYRAIHGFGWNGNPASAQKFREVLLNKKIVDMTVEPVGQPERVIVRQLVLEDGTRMHFESSGRGACCYYIEEPGGPTCTEVVENELRNSRDTQAADGSSSQNREEGGRGAQVADETATSYGLRRYPGASTTPGPHELPNPGRVPPVSETGDVLPASDSDRQQRS